MGEKYFSGTSKTFSALFQDFYPFLTVFSGPWLTSWIFQYWVKKLDFFRTLTTMITAADVLAHYVPKSSVAMVWYACTIKSLVIYQGVWKSCAPSAPCWNLNFEMNEWMKKHFGLQALRWSWKKISDALWHLWRKISTTGTVPSRVSYIWKNENIKCSLHKLSMQRVNSPLVLWEYLTQWNGLTHWGQSPHILVNELDHHWFR